MKTIVIIGGNTLGHVIPGISIVNGLRNKYPQNRIIYVTNSKQMNLKIIKESNADIKEFIDIKSLSRLNVIKEFFKLRKYFIHLYKKYKVDLVIGFGSFISSVGIITAQMLNIDTIIHEQNKVLGLGNKLCYFKTKKLLLNYPLNKKHRKSVVVGNPILVSNQSKTKKEKLVITSGSGGAKFFNDIMVDFLNNYQDNLEITFITGKKYYDEINSKINNKKIQIVDFIDDLGSYLQDVKYIITRAGATTLSEIFELGIKPIIIPSPNVSNNHQVLNALEYKDYSIILYEKNLTPEVLLTSLKKLKDLKTFKKDYLVSPVYKFIEEINDVKRLY